MSDLFKNHIVGFPTRRLIVYIATPIMPSWQHVVAKVILVSCSVTNQLKRDSVGHGEVTINNARIIIDSSFGRMLSIVS